MSVTLINSFAFGDPPLPTTPGSFTAIPGNEMVLLTWVDSFYETGYTIERGTDGVSYSALATSEAGTIDYEDTVSNGTTYYYRIRATNAQGNSAWATASATPVSPPIAPTGFTATPIDAFNVTLSWDAVGDATGYSYAARNSGIGESFGGPETDVAAGNVTSVNYSSSPSIIYEFRLRATNAGGSSTYVYAGATTPDP